jgi:hypothetical protein
MARPLGLFFAGSREYECYGQGELVIITGPLGVQMVEDPGPSLVTLMGPCGDQIVEPPPGSCVILIGPCFGSQTVELPNPSVVTLIGPRLGSQMVELPMPSRVTLTGALPGLQIVELPKESWVIVTGVWPGVQIVDWDWRGMDRIGVGVKTVGVPTPASEAEGGDGVRIPDEDVGVTVDSGVGKVRPPLADTEEAPPARAPATISAFWAATISGETRIPPLRNRRARSGLPAISSIALAVIRLGSNSNPRSSQYFARTSASTAASIANALILAASKL